MTLVNTPLGTTGSLSVTESAGVITITLNENLASLGLTAGVNVGISGATLLKAWADGTTNATLKAVLAEAATLVAALP